MKEDLIERDKRVRAEMDESLDRRLQYLWKEQGKTTEWNRSMSLVTLEGRRIFNHLKRISRRWRFAVQRVKNPPELVAITVTNEGNAQ